ncbi:GTPase-associated protein 1-related protein [Streptomyces sp. NPDC093109]|uniref:GTPase-associated protein 1-related protein n=1 Tax=Streptomyces sp. NPDC093109 TaxID=3154977 RepID=UPI00344D5043
MSLAQLHYTSVPPGPDGAGLRLAAITPGTPEPPLDEVGRIFGYEPPREHRPDAFAKALSLSALSDGGRLLARTVYAGSGRRGGQPGREARGGDFHAHAVRLPAGAALPGGALPISAWDSPGWAAGLPEGPVPAPLEGLPGTGSVDRRALVPFAAARAPWLAEFLAAVRESSEHGTAPRIVLVESGGTEVARWIALAAAVLPAESAHRLTFTTHTRRPHLAPQQIIGVLPDDARELDRRDPRYRVIDCAGPRATGTASVSGAAREPYGVWAETAARIWRGGAPEVFAEADTLPGGRFAPGPLAVVALCAGIALPTDGRTEAALWARDHATALTAPVPHRLVEALCAPAEDRTPAELAALTGLFTALDGRAPAATTAPLGALVVTEAVRSPGGAGAEPAVLRAALFDDGLRRRLAAELGTELRAGIAGDPAGDPAHYPADNATGGPADGTPGISRAVELLCVAEPLGVDCADLLPGLAHRLARALLTDPEAARTPAVRTALEEHFDLRAALLGALDTLAAADPPAAVALLGRMPLPLEGVQSLPQLRMCARQLPPSGDGDGPDGRDRVAALGALLRAAGVSPFADPLVLRTAVRLVWPESVPTADEARQLLAATGSDAHRAAGTWTVLVRAALDTAEPAHAPGLAQDLLRSFPREVDPAERRTLQLLAFAGELAEGPPTADWTARTLSLRARAEPVQPGVLNTVFAILARQLLSEARPEGELYALVHSGDAELLAAYDRAAREERVRERLRTTPAYAADCFTAWSALPGANRAWDETRTALLDKVLRPVVRALPAADAEAVARCLRERGTGDARVAEFRTWSRPGALGRLGLGRRLGGGGGGRRPGEGDDRP